MNNSIAIAFAVALVLVVCIHTSQAGTVTRCPSRMQEDYVEPDNCPYGKVTDQCNRKVCAKGPGEHCGIGVFSAILGVCGEGMFCRCGRCIGCSLNTFECYDKTCV